MQTWPTGALPSPPASAGLPAARRSRQRPSRARRGGRRAAPAGRTPQTWRTPALRPRARTRPCQNRPEGVLGLQAWGVKPCVHRDHKRGLGLAKADLRGVGVGVVDLACAYVQVWGRAGRRAWVHVCWESKGRGSMARSLVCESMGVRVDGCGGELDLQAGRKGGAQGMARTPEPIHAYRWVEGTRVDVLRNTNGRWRERGARGRGLETGMWAGDRHVCVRVHARRDRDFEAQGQKLPRLGTNVGIVAGAAWVQGCQVCAAYTLPTPCRRSAACRMLRACHGLGHRCAGFQAVVARGEGWRGCADVPVPV
eukprot:360633-Chlamydomonas_euryale.AAC.25